MPALRTASKAGQRSNLYGSDWALAHPRCRMKALTCRSQIGHLRQAKNFT